MDDKQEPAVFNCNSMILTPKAILAILDLMTKNRSVLVTNIAFSERMGENVTLAKDILDLVTRLRQ